MKYTDLILPCSTQRGVQPLWSRGVWAPRRVKLIEQLHCGADAADIDRAVFRGDPGSYSRGEFRGESRSVIMGGD